MRRVVVLLLLIVVAGGWLLGWSPYLRVTTIAVDGVVSLSRSEVIAASGVTIDQPLARVSGARIERAMTSIPRVKSVKVVRNWPNKVTLIVQERMPLGRLGNKVVDETGSVFSLSPGEKEPVLEILPLESSTRALRTWFSIYNALPIKNQILQANLSDMEDIWFRTATTRVIWGSGEQTAAKVSVLQNFDLQKWSEVDLSAPFAPTTKK